jgi:hypothetical protein
MRRRAGKSGPKSFRSWGVCSGWLRNWQEQEAVHDFRPASPAELITYQQGTASEVFLNGRFVPAKKGEMASAKPGRSEGRSGGSKSVRASGAGVSMGDYLQPTLLSEVRLAEEMFAMFRVGRVIPPAGRCSSRHASSLSAALTMVHRNIDGCGVEWIIPPLEHCRKPPAFHWRAMWRHKRRLTVERTMA